MFGLLAEKPITTKPTTETPSSVKPNKPISTPAPDYNHSYSSSVTKQPTCSTSGVKTFTCSCGYSYTEAIPAIDHKWGTAEAFAETIHHPGETFPGAKCECGLTGTVAEVCAHQDSTGYDGTPAHTGYCGCEIQLPGWDEPVTHHRHTCTTCGASEQID